MHLLVGTGFVLLGAALGPVLDHLARRAVAHAPFEFHMCPGCGNHRTWMQWLGTPCPHCANRPPRRAAGMSLVLAALLPLTVWLVGATWTLPAHLLFVVLGWTLIVTDLDARLIPNRLLYPGSFAVVVLLVAGAIADGQPARLRDSTLGAAMYFGGFLLVAMLARGGMGMGDVKLAGLLGFVVGYHGMERIVVMVAATALIGGLPALVLLASGRAGRRTELPYGPAMVLGSWVAVAAGAALLAWYRV